METVISDCGNVDQAYPMFRGQLNHHHWGFDDPAHAAGTDEEKLAVFAACAMKSGRCFKLMPTGAVTR